MSKKLYIGIFTGILIGLSIPILIRSGKDEDLFSEQDLYGDNFLLDKANQRLRKARNQVSDMLNEAEEKSTSLIKEAGEILSIAKDKTSTIRFEQQEHAKDEIKKIKDEIEERMEQFKKKIRK